MNPPYLHPPQGQPPVGMVCPLLIAGKIPGIGNQGEEKLYDGAWSFFKIDGDWRQKGNRLSARWNVFPFAWVAEEH